jgi:ketosteroid isomerase-like protein
MIDPVTAKRIGIIRDYFRKVDGRDPSLSDLFTDDVEFFFPKFGSARGKPALTRFGEGLQRHLRNLEHDIAGLKFTAAGDRIAVEGRERGVTRDGISWPDGVTSEGRFCNLFEFDGDLISGLSIYVDPDFTGADTRLLRQFHGEGAVDTTPRSVVERYLDAVSVFYANPASTEALSGVMALFSETIDWNIAGNTERVSYIGPRRGKAEVAAFYRELREAIEPLRFEVRTILSADDTVVILGDLASRVKATGKVIETEFAFDITVHDGLITRYRMLEDSYAVQQAV